MVWGAGHYGNFVAGRNPTPAMGITCAKRAHFLPAGSSGRKKECALVELDSDRGIEICNVTREREAQIGNLDPELRTVEGLILRYGLPP